MIKKILLLGLAVLLLTSPVYATMVATRTSGNTVSFNTVVNSRATTPNVVTFNTTTNWIRLQNLSTTADCYVDIRCVDSTGKSGYFTRKSATLLVPAIGKATPNTVEINFATRNLGFAGDTLDTSTNGGVSGDNQTIHYTVTGDAGSF